MTYDIYGLKSNEDGTDELVQIEGLSFNTKEEAMGYISENISLHPYTEYKDTLVLTVEGVHYHYVEVVPVPESL